MNTSKKGVRIIAEICRQRGIRKVVFSPGSRSAPLVIAFSAIPEIECIVIPDERVAGYFALGMAQQLREPVAVVCTSGTAVLNLGPAVAEAFYQNIPLLLLTADRPDGASQKGENQAIEQAFIFQKLTKASFDIDGDQSDNAALQAIANDVHLAISRTCSEGHGPVHVNIRLSEPLYKLAEAEKLPFDINHYHKTEPSKSSPEGLQLFEQHLAQFERKLIVVGLRWPDQEFAKAMEAIGKHSDIAVFVETASNLNGPGFIYNYDACLVAMGENKKTFVPDMIVTLGHQIISKRLRQWLKQDKPVVHWDISPENINRNHDTFDVGVQQLFITEQDALALLKQDNIHGSNYSGKWHKLREQNDYNTFRFWERCDYSDFRVLGIISMSLPNGTNVHYANSSPIRYANFFQHNDSLSTNSNRGVSGIDGCLSTAAGAAWVNNKPTICITGDIGFFYDSNALFNNNLASNLRIIIINNGGGNIFRLIEGPTGVKDFEKFFETGHNLRAKNLALMYGLPYYFCDTEETLVETLEEFYGPHGNKPAILEITTNNKRSEEVFKGYFESLK